MTDYSYENYLASEFLKLQRRYSGATPEAFISVLCPILIPINTLDKEIKKIQGQNHYRASFSVKITPSNRVALCRGRTGKFVPSDYGSGGLWREIAKGRIIEIDESIGVASGEVYTGSRREELVEALEILDVNDYLEIDQYGASAKVLSGLSEYSLVNIAESSGFTVKRMSEDMARHLGSYNNYDFEFTKNGITKKIEVKSLWGTNTDFARLIHSISTKIRSGNTDEGVAENYNSYYPTSSCKFNTQDIFAVSLFLRTGNITDFAFARSIPNDIKSYGLPRASKYADHVNQNPRCNIGDGTWFATIDEVWSLE